METTRVYWGTMENTRETTIVYSIFSNSPLTASAAAWASVGGPFFGTLSVPFSFSDS